MAQPNVVHPQQVPVANAGLRVDTAQRRYPVEFSATAWEYFRIWIVNLALTVVTLGIYSAWATVRKRRYFYGRTRIDGEGLEYRANPIAILKGRLIAFVLFAAFSIVSQYAPLYIWVFYLALLIAGPWLIVRSLAFNAYNTAYRNVRLRFSGSYATCLRLVLGYGLLTIVTLGFGFAFLKRRLVQYAMENHAYGTTSFTLGEAFKKPFIRPYVFAYVAGILAMSVMFGLGFVLAARGVFAKSGAGITPGMAWLMVAGAFLFYGGLFALLAYVKARTINAVWNNLSIGPMRFESAVRARDMLWLFFSNALAVVFTLGLATPWAVVRSARYRASKTAAVAAGPLDNYVQAESRQISAVGEEVGEMFDIDIAL
jgi:uncharacterized membrane protein YjgN (DUF898 family)